MNINRMFRQALAVFLCIVLNAGAANYYIDKSNPNANDSNNGSINQPWKTLNKGFATAQAGDTVFVKAGTYSVVGTGERYLPALNPANSGTAGNKIVFKRFNTDLVTIQMGSNTGPIIGTYEKNYITIDGFKLIEGSSYGGDHGVISIWSSNNVDVFNCEVVGSDVPTNQNNHNAIRIEGVQNVLVKNNVLHGIYGDGHNNSAITLYRTRNVIVENNEFYDSERSFYQKCDNKDFIFRYNYVHDTGGILVSDECTGVQVTNSEYYQNIFKNTSPYAINMMAHVSDLKIYNNAIYNSGDNGDYGALSANNQNGDVSGVQFFNNIVSNSQQPIHFWSNWQMILSFSDYNNFNSSTPFRQSWQDIGDGSLSAWQSNSGNDGHSTNSDPLFVSVANGDFHLKSGSPLLNAGIDRQDYNNNGNVNESINLGPYIRGDEIIGTGSQTIGGGGTGTIVLQSPTGLSVQR